MSQKWLKKYLQSVPDFPRPGVTYHWFGDLFRDPEALHRVTDALNAHFRDKKIDKIIGLEARGFIFGALVAYQMNKPFVLMRKGGALPPPKHTIEFEREYGKASFEMEEKALSAGEKVAIVDDLLATGGSFQAAASLVENANGEIVEIACVFELAELKGRDKLNYPVFTLYSI